LQFKGRVTINRGETTEDIPRLALSGMRKTFRKFNYEANTSTILVTFTETGAYQVFKRPLFELFEDIESLDSFFAASEVSELEEKIYTAIDNYERIRYIENYLISKLICVDADKLVWAAVNEIHKTTGIVNICYLANHFALSQDAFEKRFRKIVGSSPKQFSTIVRMKFLLAKEPGSKSMTDLAYRFEFYDQAHFIKQFKSFTGQTPKDFFKAPYIWEQ